jgi:hypothetical protein
MSQELSEDEILENDIDPMDAINAIRREEEKSDPTSDSVETVDTDTSDQIDEPIEETVSDSDSEDTTSETSEEVASEEEPLSEEVKEDEVKEAIKRKFKANGQDFEFTDDEIMSQFEGVFGKAMDYTQKMQKIAPYRKMISALEEESITQDQFDMALDILKGDKGAIKKLAADRDIDLSDLSFEDDDAPYNPTRYGKTDFEIKIDEIDSQISKDPEYSTTVDVIDKQWDDMSRKSVADNPDIILGLHNDVKSGVYAKVAPEAAKLQMLDGNSKSSLDYYLLAGAEYQKATQTDNGQKQVDDLNKGAQEAETKFGKESSEAESKRAATSTGSRSGQKSVVDYLDDGNDEKFDAWYKNLEQAN